MRISDWCSDVCSSYLSGDPSLHAAPAANEAPLPADWWRAFNDPVLDELQARAVSGSPDLRTAALHVAQARIQRGATEAQGQIGRASCRERVCRYVSISVVAVSYKKITYYDVCGATLNDDVIV